MRSGFQFMIACMLGSIMLVSIGCSGYRSLAPVVGREDHGGHETRYPELAVGSKVRVTDIDGNRYDGTVVDMGAGVISIADPEGREGAVSLSVSSIDRIDVQDFKRGDRAATALLVGVGILFYKLAAFHSGLN